MILLLSSSCFEALAISALLHSVFPSLAEAMATSADNFIVFFLCTIFMLFSEELQIFRPTNHFLRNSCLNAVVVGRIVDRISNVSLTTIDRSGRSEDNRV